MDKPLPCPCCGQPVYVAELDARYSWYAIAHTKTAGCTVTAKAGGKAELIQQWNRRAPVKPEATHE